MANVYDPDIELAKEMIAEDGASCVWYSETQTEKDPAKPWRGTNATATPIPCDIVFLDAVTAKSLVQQWAPGMDFSADKSYGLMPSVPFSPAISEKVERGATVFILSASTSIEPNGVPILYILEFQA